MSDKTPKDILFSKLNEEQKIELYDTMRNLILSDIKKEFQRLLYKHTTHEVLLKEVLKYIKEQLSLSLTQEDKNIDNTHLLSIIFDALITENNTMQVLKNRQMRTDNNINLLDQTINKSLFELDDKITKLEGKKPIDLSTLTIFPKTKEKKEKKTKT